MSLAAGARLGPYEILTPLGAGGMGEVYRARDPRLGREVAIKVLPADLQAHPDRLKRFEQEARAAGGLNHPNLLSVLDIGSAEGVPFIVFELLEGHTLRDALSRGSLPPRKALDFAVQIAQGLGAAHDKGIVHRDLKPENVFVTVDGRVKILDFGLAKLRPDFNPGGSGSDVATKSALTGPGVVLGTVGYMSPEQVQGLPTDARSDIFSFGTVLYEMLSGRRAFLASSAVSTMHAILEKDPPPLTETGRELPPALEPIVMRCLEKQREGRFQSARDLAFALEAIARGSGSRASLAGAPLAPMRSPARAWLAALSGAIALALALLAAVRLGYLQSPWAADKAPPSYTRLTFRRGTVDGARFAPDGQTIVYSAAWNGKPDEVFTTRPGATESRTQIDPMEQVFKGMRHASRMNLYFSPDLEESVAREKFEDLLAGQRNKHLFWVGVDFGLTILAILLTPVLVPLPGPNIFLYFPGLRMFSHYLAWRGTLNGLKLEDRSFIPLAEISSIERVLSQRVSKVDFEHLRDLSRRLKLEHLPKFLERYS